MRVASSQVVADWKPASQSRSTALPRMAPTTPLTAITSVTRPSDGVGVLPSVRSASHTPTTPAVTPDRKAHSTVPEA